MENETSINSPNITNQNGEEENLRAKQVKELQILQRVLDENNELRAKYNALQVQVAPVVDHVASTPQIAGSQFQNERQISPEEFENCKQQLENTLLEYRKATQNAGKINQQLERHYTELNELKFQTRLIQDERLNHQNEVSALSIAAIKAKLERIKESWNIERQRLAKSVSFLKNIHDTANNDVKEYEQQMKTNNRGIGHLSTSIQIAKDDIREFLAQQQEIAPKIKEYEELEEKNQDIELLVVRLSDENEELRKEVETESLTAKVRKQLDSGNQTIADLNRSIDQIQGKTTAIYESIREKKSKIAELEQKFEKIVNDTNEIVLINQKLMEQKKTIHQELYKCAAANYDTGGDNLVLEKEVFSGIGLEPTSTATIRKQMLSLKKELKELDDFERKQNDLESDLKVSQVPKIPLPQRKRVPMIPLIKTTG